jgi:hypothetical protein
MRGAYDGALRSRGDKLTALLVFSLGSGSEIVLDDEIPGFSRAESTRRRMLDQQVVAK